MPWLKLTYTDGSVKLVETTGETWLNASVAGSPYNELLTTFGLRSVVYSDEHPDAKEEPKEKKK